MFRLDREEGSYWKKEVVEDIKGIKLEVIEWRIGILTQVSLG